MKKMMKYLLPLIMVLLAVSCIENDLSYPYAPGDILSFEVEGQKSLTIDKENRTVNIVLEEDADITYVKLKSFSFSNNATVVDGLPDYLNLSDPVTIVLRVYEDYVWTINAEQPIERYIRCDNQVGEAMLDVEEKRAYVYVDKSQPLSAVRFNEIKLEPTGSVVARTEGFVDDNGVTRPQYLECDFPMVLDCHLQRYFYVKYQGEEIKWSMVVLQKEVDLQVQEVNPWAYFAVVKGVASSKSALTVEYRSAADSDWTTIENVSMSGASVTAEIRNLAPESDYVVRFSDGVSNSEKTFTTQKEEQLANLSFDDWYMAGKAWMPNPNESIQIWDTANPGSASLGLVPTLPEEKIVVKGKAVKMVTAVAPVINMLAAGNIYTGKFDKLKGLGAELDWGVPFGARPLALRGYYKYIPQTINVGKDPDYIQYVGNTDQCQIQVFLAEWDKPFHVSSSQKQFVDRNDKSIIAFAEFYTDEENEEYKRFTLPIVYNDNRMPTYIVMSACSSRFGNYFVGAAPTKDENGNEVPGSILYVDEFELVYDPSELTPEEYAAVFSKVKAM